MGVGGMQREIGRMAALELLFHMLLPARCGCREDKKGVTPGNRGALAVEHEAGIHGGAWRRAALPRT
jgi:hypothetical protein